MEYENIFQEIKEKASLVDEVEKSGCRLSRSGNTRLKGCCPLHGEKTPSFMVYLESEPMSFYCWGCKKGGTVIDFVRDFNGFDLNKTIDYFKRSYELTFSNTTKTLEEMLEDFNNHSYSENYKKDVGIYNYAFILSKKIKQFLTTSSSFKEDYKRIEPYLRSLDQSIFDQDREKYKFNKKLLEKYIKEIRK